MDVSAAEPGNSAPSAEAPPKISLLNVASILLINRLGLWVIAYLALATSLGPHSGTNGLPGNLFMAGWLRWDGQWYARIAEHGYTNVPFDESGQPDTHFFPVYPLVVRGVAFLVGDVYVAGLLISNTAFVLAGMILFALVRDRFDESTARRAIVLVSVFPFAYAFSAMYTESLFLLLCVGAFYCAHRRWWLSAGLCAAAAGATRLVGSCTAVALATMTIAQPDTRPAYRWRQIASVAVACTGLAAWACYLGVRFGHPLIFLTSQNAKGWGDVNSFADIAGVPRVWFSSSFNDIAAGQVPMNRSIHLVTAVFACAICVVGWFKLPRAYALWTTLILIICFWSTDSYGRYVATTFPLFITAAILLKDPRLYHGVIYLSVLLLALLTMLFVQSYWVA